MNRFGWVLLVAAALAGSCSGTGSSEREAGLGADAVTTSTPIDAGAAEVPDPAPPVARDLMAIDEQEIVGVGTWTSPLLGDPVTFDVTQDLVLTRSAPGLMTFRLSEDDAVVITMLNPTGVVVPALGAGFSRFEQVAYPTDLGVWLEESPDIDLLDSGSLVNQGLEAAPAWFEVATSDLAEEVDECSVGKRCLRVFANPIARLVAISEPDVTAHRIYQLTGGASPLVAVVSAPVGSDDTVFAPIDAIAESLCVCGPSIDLGTVRPEPIELLLNQSVFPAGAWQTTMGTTDFTIRNSTPINASLVISDPGVLIGLTTEADDGSQKGIAIVVAGVWRLVDPALANNQADATLDGLDTRDIEAWAEQHPNVRVEGSGITTLGGQSATWWDLVGESITEEGSYSCWHESIPVEELPDDVDPLERCVTILVIKGEPGSQSYIGEELKNEEPIRIYVFDDLDLMITVEPFQPIDEALGVADDFLDHLDIQAAAPDPNEESDLALLEAAWIEALAVAAAVPSEPDLTTWCVAALAAQNDRPDMGDTPEQAEANAAARETLVTKMTRLSNDGARDAAEMLLAGTLVAHALLETADWNLQDFPPGFFLAAMPDSIDAGGRDDGIAYDDLVQHWTANCGEWLREQLRPR